MIVECMSLDDALSPTLRLASTVVLPGIALALVWACVGGAS